MADDFVICTIELKTPGSEPIDIAKGIIEYERVRNMHSAKHKLRNIESIANIKANQVVFKEISRYQTVDFDLSIIVDKNVKYKDIEDVINNSNLEYLQNYDLIDVYENEEKLKNKKNITIRFTIGSYDKTLTKEEIDEERCKLTNSLASYNMIING